MDSGSYAAAMAAGAMVDALIRLAIIIGVVLLSGLILLGFLMNRRRARR